MIELVHAGETVDAVRPARTAWDADDIVDVVFDSDSATPVRSAGAGPLTGVSRPQDATGLNRFDGKPAAGTWTLRITDAEPNDAGVLNEWGVDGRARSSPARGSRSLRPRPARAGELTPNGATVSGAVDPERPRDRAALRLRHDDRLRLGDARRRTSARATPRSPGPPR